MKISLKSTLEVYLPQENELTPKSVAAVSHPLELLGATHFRLKLNNQVFPPAFPLSFLLKTGSKPRPF